MSRASITDGLTVFPEIRCSTIAIFQAFERLFISLMFFAFLNKQGTMMTFKLSG